MPHCVDYCISKISVRAVECVYTSQTTALIIGSKYPQHCRSKDKVIWTASICLPGTHQLEARVTGSIRTVEEKDIQKTFKDNTVSAECISTLSHYHFILLFTISSCIHYCSVLFPCDCLTFWIFCYYKLC